MKKYLLIAGAFCMVAIPPAAAVVKCVALDSGLTKCSAGVFKGAYDWRTNCDTNNKETVIDGIAGCSSEDNSGALTYLQIDATTQNNNRHCYCKIIHPVMSNWVKAFSFSNSLSCTSRCVEECAKQITANQPFRYSLIKSI